jgi:hypothetical protein
MNKLLVAFAMALLATGSAAATERTDVLAPVHKFIDGFNSGDVNSSLAACADQTSIIDEFPPHEWHGTNACTAWANDFAADAKKNGLADFVVTLGNPRHVDVTGGHAYVVVPANLDFKEKGKPAREVGSMMTFALQKDTLGWRITAWSWAKN